MSKAFPYEPKEFGKMYLWVMVILSWLSLMEAAAKRRGLTLEAYLDLFFQVNSLATGFLMQGIHSI